MKLQGRFPTSCSTPSLIMLDIWLAFVTTTELTLSWPCLSEPQDLAPQRYLGLTSADTITSYVKLWLVLLRAALNVLSTLIFKCHLIAQLPCSSSITLTDLNNFVSLVSFVSSPLQVIYEYVQQHKPKHKPPRNNLCDTPLLQELTIFSFSVFCLFPISHPASVGYFSWKLFRTANQL